MATINIRTVRFLAFGLLMTGVTGNFFMPGANFLDCGWQSNYNGPSRVCCLSDQVPNGCECFDINWGTDFNNSFFMKPSCPDEVVNAFRLYTPDNTENGSVIKAGEDAVKSSEFQVSLPTIFLVHGYTDSGTKPWLGQSKDELLKNRACNVIIVDWEKGAKGPNYFKAVANTRMVGAMIGKLVYDLNQYLGASPDNFHLVGHSLGSHVMGYAGKEFTRQSGEQLGRITGLDPAGPAYETTTANVRLDKSDAKFVDSIHTDAEPLLEAGYGIQRNVGHADFWPNGGVHQPGCAEESYGILSLISTDEEGACSHQRVVKLFKYSVNVCTYTPPTEVDCPMGFHANPNCLGNFLLNTTDTEPYC